MWVPLALFEASLNSFLAILTKHQVKTIHPIVVLFFNMLFVLIFMVGILFFFGGFPHVTGKFFALLLCSSALDVVAFSAGYWAIKHTDISLLSPLGSLTPVFATFFAAIFLHEIPTPLKLVGIVTIVIGAYLLNIANVKESLFKPFQKLLAEKGVKVYFIQVILWGITPLFQKSAIFQTHPTRPLFASFVGFFFVTFYLSLFVLPRIRKEPRYIQHHLEKFVLYGFVYAISQWAAYTVLSLTYIGYATALVSLSSLLSIILGGMIFKEKNIQERLLGAGVMVIGVILLAL